MPSFVNRYMTTAQWASMNPVLLGGEIGLEIGTDGNISKFKIGDGVRGWNELNYFSSEAGYRDLYSKKTEFFSHSMAGATTGMTLPSIADTGQQLTWTKNPPNQGSTGKINGQGGFWTDPSAAPAALYGTVALEHKPVWGLMRFRFYPQSTGGGTACLAIPSAANIAGSVTMAPHFRTTRTGWAQTIWDGSELPLGEPENYDVPLIGDTVRPVTYEIAFVILGTTILFRTADGNIHRRADSRLPNLGGAFLFAESYDPAATDDVVAISLWQGGNNVEQGLAAVLRTGGLTAGDLARQMSKPAPKIFKALTLASMGDSTTERNHDIDAPYILNSNSWADIGVLLSGSRIQYIGDAATGGMDIAAIRATHLPKILAKQPTFCTVLAGQNSLASFGQDDIDDLTFIYKSLMDNGTTPILIGNIPSNDTVVQHRLNDFVAAYAQTYNLPYFDMAAQLIDRNTGLYKTGMSTDGTHADTPLAISLITNAFSNFLKSLLTSRAVPPVYLLPQSKKEGVDKNPFFDPSDSDATIAKNWFVAQDCTTALSDTTVGKKFRVTKKNPNLAQVNGPTWVLIPGHEYFISCLIEASVQSVAGTWTLSLLNIGGNYTSLVAFEGQVTDVPADTLLSVRFRVPLDVPNPGGAGQVIPIMQLGSLAGYTTGSAGATMAISQLAIRHIEF